MKICNSVFSIGRSFCSIDQNDKEIYTKVFLYFDQCSIPVLSIEKSIRSIETHKTVFSTEFSVTVLNV